MKLLFILIIYNLFLNIVNSISPKTKFMERQRKKTVVFEFQTDNPLDCEDNNTELYFSCQKENGNRICGCSKKNPNEMDLGEYRPAQPEIIDLREDRPAPPDSDIEIETKDFMICRKRNLEYGCRFFNIRLICGCLKDKNKGKPVCKEDEELAFYRQRDEYICVKKRIKSN